MSLQPKTTHNTPATTRVATKMSPIVNRTLRSSDQSSDQSTPRPTRKRSHTTLGYTDEFERRRKQQVRELVKAADSHTHVQNSADLALITYHKEQHAKNMDHYQKQIDQYAKDKEIELEQLRILNEALSKTRADEAKIAKIEKEIADAHAAQIAEALQKTEALQTAQASQARQRLQTAESLQAVQAVQALQAAEDLQAAQALNTVEAKLKAQNAVTTTESTTVNGTAVPVSGSASVIPPKGSRTFSMREKQDRATKYITLANRLRDFHPTLRADFRAAKQSDVLMTLIGAVNRNCGQITHDFKVAEERAANLIDTVLKTIGPCSNPGIKDYAASHTVNIKDYAFDIDTDQPFESGEAPSLLIFVMGFFAYKVVCQLRTDNPELIKHLAHFAMTIFSDPRLFIQGKSLVSMILAELHKRAGALFGIYRSFRTGPGPDDVTQLSYPSDIREVLQVATGFAFLGFWQPPSPNIQPPIPPRFVWSALAYLYNMPAKFLDEKASVLCQGIIMADPKRLIELYKDNALSMIRYAAVGFPGNFEDQSQAAYLSTVLAQQLKKIFDIEI